MSRRKKKTAPAPPAKEWKPGTPFSFGPCSFCGEALLYDPDRPVATSGIPNEPGTVVNYHLDCMQQARGRMVRGSDLDCKPQEDS